MNFGTNSSGKFSNMKKTFDMRESGSGRRVLGKLTQEVVHLEFYTGDIENSGCSNE
jgi:hypothetical protein